jgi:hypothetical protein
MNFVIYEIRANNPSREASYEAYGVTEGQRIGFVHNGNQLFGTVVGCGRGSLLVKVDQLSF